MVLAMERLVAGRKATTAERVAAAAANARRTATVASNEGYCSDRRASRQAESEDLVCKRRKLDVDETRSAAAASGIAA